MSEDGVVRGRRISTVKKERSKELRHRMTPEEAVLWSELRTNRLFGLHFRRQQVIDGFIVDFYCHAARLIVEVDGGIHATQGLYDEVRDEWLQACGFTILRFANDEVTSDLPGVLARVAAACGAGAQTRERPPK